MTKAISPARLNDSSAALDEALYRAYQSDMMRAPYDYIRAFSAEWGILTNGEEFYVYRRHGDNYLPEKVAEMQIDDLPRASVLESLKRSSFYGSS